MKNLLLLLFLSFSYLATAQYDAPITIAERICSYPQVSKVADFNGDGYQDIISLDANSSILIFMNDGKDNFLNPISAYDNLVTFRYGMLEIGDLDNDGDIDVLVVLEHHYKKSELVCLLNNGKGKLTSKKVVKSNNHITKKHHLIDVDGDSDLDIICYISNTRKLVWYSNAGNGSFSLAIPIGNTLNAPIDLIWSSDMDQDGDLDILCLNTLSDTQVTLYDNKGQGIFSMPEPILVLPQKSQIRTADINNDGKVDIVAATNRNISWYEHQEGNHFIKKQDVALPGFVTYQPQTFHTTDLNGDGHIDIIVNYVHKKKIICLTNDGTGTYWGEMIVAYNEGHLKTMYISDFNKDGQIDILGTSSVLGKIELHQNKGRSTFENITINPINTNTFLQVIPTDLDATGDLDLFLTKRQGIEQFVNQGNLSFSAKESKFENKDRNSKTLIGDLNNDGYKDVVILSKPHLYVFENDKNGGFRLPKAYKAENIKDIQLIDANNDDQLDIFMATKNRILSRYNDGSGRFSKPTLILDELGIVENLYTVDIDNDGFLDVFFTSDKNHTLGWSKNRKHGKFGKAKILVEPSSMKHNREVKLVDINDDNAIDIVINSDSSGISCYQNKGKGVFFGNQILIEQNYKSPIRALSFTDVDSDGDTDIVFSIFSNTLWYEQIDNLEFTEEKMLFKNHSGKINAADMDGDGLEDLILNRENQLLVFKKQD